MLSGGGARGAYQAGALAALNELHKEAGIEFPRILAGVSAGAINASFIASQMDQLDLGVAHLLETWNNIQAEDVFRTDYSSVTRNAMKLVKGLSLGGFSDRLRPVKVGLLNTSPLFDLLSQKVPFERIAENLKSGALKALAVSATDYSTSIGVTFVQGVPGLPTWSSSNRFSLNTEIKAEHICASSAIPLFFPPIEVNQRFYGDGCLRNTAPLSPAVHLGAEKLIVVGVRIQSSIADFRRPALSPSLGRVLSVLINAIFMDAVEADLERLRIVNETVKKLQAEGMESRFRPVSSIYLRPSRDLAKLAESRSNDLPSIIRFLFKGLGSAAESAELLSYLLFEPPYCSSLLELGYEDTLKRKEELLEFLKG